MSALEPTVAPATENRAVASRISRFLIVGLSAAAALAVAFLPPLAALWLVVGSGVVVLVIARPVIGLFLLPFAVGFGSVVDVTVRGVNVGPTDLLVGVLVLACAWRLWTTVDSPGGGLRVDPRQRLSISSARVREAWRRDPLQLALYAALAGYLAVTILSLAVATDRISTLKEILKWGEVAMVVACAAYILGNEARGLGQVRVLAWATILAGALQAALGLVQSIVTGGSRVVGTFDQPNPFAGFLNFALPLALALVLFSPDVRERWMALAAVGLLGAGEFVARSRGATLGVVAAALVIAVIGWRRERLAAKALLATGIAIPLAVVAWIAHVIPLSVQQRLLDEVRLDDAALCSGVNGATFSTKERLAHWAAGLRMFAAHPLLGVGAGNFDAAYTRYNTWCWPASLGHAHNYYITTAAETGVLGLIVFLALTGVTLALGWQATHPAARIAGAARLAADPSLVASPVASPAAAAVVMVTPSTESPAVTYASHAPHLTPHSTPHSTPHLTPREQTLARALAIGFFATLVALTVHNLTDNLFVHAMELQFALCVAALLRLRVLWRSGA